MSSRSSNSSLLPSMKTSWPWTSTPEKSSALFYLYFFEIIKFFITALYENFLAVFKFYWQLYIILIEKYFCLLVIAMHIICNFDFLYTQTVLQFQSTNNNFFSIVRVIKTLPPIHLPHRRIATALWELLKHLRLLLVANWSGYYGGYAKMRNPRCEAPSRVWRRNS